MLDRIVRLPGMKGTVYALLGKVSEQSGYLFIYDSKVIHNDSVVRVRKQECSVRQAIHRITGSRNLELKVLGNHILITRAAEKEEYGRNGTPAAPTGIFHHCRNPAGQGDGRARRQCVGHRTRNLTG